MNSKKKWTALEPNKFIRSPNSLPVNTQHTLEYHTGREKETRSISKFLPAEDEELVEIMHLR